MDIKKLQLFVITSETKKISRTAEITGYTQSGVSHILKSLEKEVGIQLFVRDRYGVHLTPLGSDFLIYVKRFLAENDRLEQFVYDLHGLEVGTITVGCYWSIANKWMPDLISKFSEAHPNIKFIIREAGAEQLHAWTSDFEIDLSIFSKQPKFDYDFISLANDPMVAVLPPNHPLANEDSVPIRSFAGENFIQSETGVDYDIYSILSKEKINPNIKYSSTDDQTIIAMVEAGLGTAILPKLSTQVRTGNYVVRPLTPERHRELGIGIKSMNMAPPIVRSFIYTIESYVKELGL